MRIFRRNRDALTVASDTAVTDESDVFLAPQSIVEDASTTPGDVTLFVYGWHSVAPGPLSWSFPSIRAALDAVQKMKNAIGWCIVAGKGHPSVEDARASGAVLVEQFA
jgi:hypothetical protein